MDTPVKKKVRDTIQTTPQLELIESEIKSLSKGSIPQDGVIFVDPNGALAYVGEVPKYEEYDGKYSGFMRYKPYIDLSDTEDILYVDYIATTKKEVEELVDYKEEYEGDKTARIRGLRNLFKAAEAVASLLGYNRIRWDTWMFIAYPKLMEGLGFKPSSEEEQEMHDSSIEKYRKGSLTREELESKTWTVEYEKELERPRVRI